MVKKILLLSANATNTSKLRLDEEVREIEAGLERAKRREEFEIISKWAVRADDLRRALLDYEPHIVHFSGHGTGSNGLVLENNSGKMQLVSTQSLARLFKLFKDEIECVVLNACYSEEQAKAIHQHIDYVVGMQKAIGDNAAIEFAVGFYDGLGAGRTIDDAFELGCISIDLEGIPESETPVLKSRNNGSASLSAREEINHIYKIQNNFFLEEPEGQVSLDSPFYVEFPLIEADCYEAIVKPGALIRIKAPRQMGKTSLMTRILHYANQQGYQSAFLNFQEIDAEFLTSLDKFLQWFCASITDELNLPERLDDYWKSILGSKKKSTKYFEKHLLSSIESPITLGLDEVDEVFKHPQIATHFFGLLRSWHERGKNEVIWKKLRLVIVHSKEAYIPLNINQSPFNVGVPIELPEMRSAQVQDQVQRHGLSWSNSEVEQLIALVGGHPYLVRVALYQIARGRMTLEKLKQVAPTEEGLYSDHLRRHLLNLEEDTELLAALKRVVAADVPIDIGTTLGFKLRSLGLVKFHGNAVIPLCDLYRQYFRDRLEVN